LRQSAPRKCRPPAPSACSLQHTYSKAEFVEKLRRLADAIETGERFDIQIAGERIYVPVRARFNIEHERSKDGEEIEFQIKWEKD
jgi:amphi-Trp domain-containing protein